MLTDVERCLAVDAKRHAQHFAADHLAVDLKGRAISSTFVTVLAQAMQFILMLGATAILARTLAPRDFGLVAMVTTITGFLRIFNDAGLSTATIQRESITHTQVSNLFWTNVTLGSTISVLLAAFSPLLASFYREPRLVGITLALCLTFVITSSAVQHLALLKRLMEFKKVAFIQVTAAAASALTGVGMVWMHCGYWSLVGMQLSAPLVSFLLAWFFSGWRPQLPRRSGGTRSLLHFGAHLTASSLLWSLARGADEVLIGRVYGPAALGLYNRAGALLMRPLEQFMPAVDSVFVPTLSRLQCHPERYRRALLNIFEVAAMASFLCAGLLLALSYPLTLFVLGPKWEASARVFAAFTLVALSSPLGSICTWILTSQARGRNVLGLTIGSSIVTVVAFFVGLPYGPVGVALAFSVSRVFIVAPLQYYIAGRKGPVTTKDLWKSCLIHLPLWFVVWGVTWFARSMLIAAAPWKQLVICCPAGLLGAFLFICAYPPSRRTALKLFEALRELKSRQTTDIAWA